MTAMHDERVVALIRAEIGAGEAMSTVASVAGVTDVAVDRQIYYPYHWYRAAGSAPGLFGRRPVSLSCLVDACNGVVSTADSFTLDEVTVSGAVLVSARQDAGEAGLAARRYVTHALGRGLRTVANFNVDLDHRGVVYKSFWALRCGDSRVLLDGVTGRLHPLAC